MEVKAVRKPLKSCAFTNGDNTRFVWMDRANRLERTELLPGSRAQCGALPLPIQTYMTANLVDLPGFQLSKAGTHFLRMRRPPMTTDDARRVAEGRRIGGWATSLRDLPIVKTILIVQHLSRFKITDSRVHRYRCPFRFIQFTKAEKSAFFRIKAEHKEARALCRCAEIGRIENDRPQYNVAAGQQREGVIENVAHVVEHEPANVLHHKETRLQLRYQTEEMSQQRPSRVVFATVTHDAESLAGGSAEDAIDTAPHLRDDVLAVDRGNIGKTELRALEIS